jgi:hypothetical protein
MNTIIRRRFTLGIVFFLVIILLLSVSSAYFLNMLSEKTSAILKENHYSVAYARNMAKSLTNINQEIFTCILSNKNPDKVLINKELELFRLSFQLEKNNITEIGEDQIASAIETSFNEYRDYVRKFIKLQKPFDVVHDMQMKFGDLYQQLMLLSQLNEKAIEEKTDDAKASAKYASIKMSIIGTVCFLIAFGFTFSIGSYFNERFFQLYNGIKEIVSSKYSERLFMSGKDEIYEVSLIFNEMAEKLHGYNEKMDLNLQTELRKDLSIKDIQELKSILIQIKSVEEQTLSIISRIENKK